MGKPIVTLTTDFGTRDGYVGAVKGVIKRINPEAELVDITHQVEPFDVLEAAFALMNSYVYFPKGSIHLVVVDPGVGSQRQPLLIQSEDFFFVGPDNGVFSFVYDSEKMTDIIIPSKQKYFLAELSSTFHARDIFAPVAAYLSLGVQVNEFGSSAKECIKFILPQPKQTRKGLAGEIIHVDKFGNLVTNVSAELLQKKRIAVITIGKRQIKRVSRSYFDIPRKGLGALVGSSGFLEIAANQGSAQQITKSRIGTSIRIAFK
jgi:S-adenosylmethionine hydrolase